MRDGVSRSVLAIAAALTVLGAFSTACRKSTSPPIPPTSGGPTLETLWPHADSTMWIYVQSHQIGVVNPYYYPDSASVPVATIALADSMLAKHPQANAIPGADSAYYLQMFNGTLTTSSGAIGQRLQSSTISFPTANASHAPRIPAAAVSRRDPMVERLWWARPDLRARLPRPVHDRIDGVVMEPLFVRAYAWASTPSAIVGYGDLYTDPAWLYLESNVSTGHVFNLQLVRTLADDVWLRGKVVGVFNGMTSRGAVTDGRIVHYLVDYGLAQDTDVNGNAVGFYRYVTYGRVIFAPGIGAVADYEENYVSVAPTVEESGFRLKLEIFPTDTPLDPVARSGDGSLSAAGWRPRR